MILDICFTYLKHLGCIPPCWAHHNWDYCVIIHILNLKMRQISKCTYMGESHLEGKYPSNSRKWCIILPHYREVSPPLVTCSHKNTLKAALFWGQLGDIKLPMHGYWSFWYTFGCLKSLLRWKFCGEKISWKKYFIIKTLLTCTEPHSGL